MAAPIRILMVDDNPDDLVLISRILRKDIPDVDLVECRELRAFQAAVGLGGISLVITDYYLGWTDGLSVVKTVKARWPAVPVIMFTGTGGEEIAVEAMKQGVEDYILKSPTYLLKLSAAVRVALERSRRPPPPAPAAAIADPEFSQILERLPIAVIAADTSGKPCYVNALAKEILGVGVVDVDANFLTAAYQMYVAGTDKIYPNERRPLIRALAGERVHVDDVELHRDGKVISLEIAATPVRDKDGKIVMAIATFMDVSETRRIQNQLRLSQRMEAIGRLAGGVAHDFNNLLTVINGHAEMLLSQMAPKDAATAEIDQIHQAGLRAAELTHQLLAFGRRQVLKASIVNLNSIVEEAAKEFIPVLGDTIMRVLTLAPELATVRADAAQMRQVIVNLALHARDSMPMGGTLSIRTANVDLDEAYTKEHPLVAPGPYVQLTVADTGAGMDTATRAHIFEPFFATKDKGRGAGLGLAMVYGIVKQSGGYIWVFSERDRGSTFEIFLPQVHEKETPKPSASPLGTTHGRETILLVEDEPMVRTVGRESLRRMGYQVVEAESGEAALQVLKEHKGTIHLLLTDVIMPGLSGPDLARQASVLRPSMKILFASGYAGETVVRHRLMDNAVHFIQKPFSPNDLGLKVREVIDSD